MTRDDWFLFSRGLAKHTFTDTTTWTNFFFEQLIPNHTKYIKNISLKLRNSKIRSCSCWCWLFAFLFIIISSFAGVSSSIYLIWTCVDTTAVAHFKIVHLSFLAHTWRCCESKSWKSQKNRYKFIIRMGAARWEVLFLAFIAGKRKDKKKQQQRVNQNYSILSFVWMRLATFLAYVRHKRVGHSCQSKLYFFRFWVLAFGFGMAWLLPVSFFFILQSNACFCLV